MAEERRSVKIELDADIERQVERAAARRDMSVRDYCEAAIKDEVDRDQPKPIDKEAMLRLRALRDEIFQGKPVPGNSVDIIREMREGCDAQLDETR